MSTTFEERSLITLADTVPGPRQGRWTYSDYATLDDGQRYEILHGVLLMTPAPSIMHQRTSGRFFRYLSACIEDNGLGLVLEAPTDVELAPKNVVQPDVLVVLNAGRAAITDSRIVGPPDLIVEIASPGTALYDRLNKHDVYAHAGVTEYWIANPTARTIEVLLLEGDEYSSLGVFRGQETLPSRIVPEMTAQVAQFFP